MPKDRATDGGELFIVDNSDKEWKVRDYLSEWADIAKSFDVLLDTSRLVLFWLWTANGRNWNDCES